jgi:hypothetical protein
MFAFAITRLDSGAEGIHLAWNSPDVLSVSAPGFDIQRRAASGRVKFQCVSLGDKELIQLRARHELATLLGPMLYGQSGPLQPFGLPGSTGPWPAGNAPVDVFTQELSAPTNAVKVAGTTLPSAPPQAFSILAVAMSGGKAVASASGPGDGSVILLTGNAIDAVVVYFVATATLIICVEEPLDPQDANWTNVPYLVRGLTLPIREADTSLTTAAAELSAAQKRLAGTETFSQVDFAKLAPALRQAVNQPKLGRTGERILLLRTTLDEPFEERPFSNHLALLQLHPALRRILGFGYFDHQSSGLVTGQAYEYRITGHFSAEDLTSTVYDVHTIPSRTNLPATFHIADLRLSFPSPVSIILDPAPPGNVLTSVSRRGMQIVGESALPGWIGPSLENWSVIIDLPRATTSVILETGAVHSFRYAGGDPWSFPGGDAAAPPGPRVSLVFANPVSQIRLRGKGVLFAVRIPAASQTGVAAVVADTGQVNFAAQPLPGAPLNLTVSNLQDPGSQLTTLAALERGPRRPLPGFELVWLPAVAGNVNVWPPGSTAPPMDSIAFQIEHRNVTLPSTFGAWEPIQPGDNLVFGTRDNLNPALGLEFGANLNELFPLRWPRSAGAGYTLHLSDVFDLNDPGGVFQRKMPAFGTSHQYRIRAMDTVGRTSSGWTESNIIRLEKHIPPPLPTGPQPEPPLITQPDGSARLSGVPGAKARALVAGDASLSAADLAILGAHKNAIVLDWGWRDSERQLDSLTREFRVYYWLNPPDIVPGNITSITSTPDGWDLNFGTNRLLEADECAGQSITTGGYPFRISSHTAGSAVTIHVESALANPAATPAMGSAQFGRPLVTLHQRPALWDRRDVVIPLGPAASYRHVFYDLLNLSPSHPVDSIWVGVSAADAESYVSDELPAAAVNGGRNGNECSIVTCVVAGRDHTRPVFAIPPPTGDIPELVAEEPAGRQILVELDLRAMIPGALPPGEPIALDRCATDTLFAILSLNGSNQIQLQMKDGTRQVIAFPNPGDEAAVVAVLQSPNPERLASRFLLFLAANHPSPNEIFERASDNTSAFGVVVDRLAPKPARYFYRVRRADALGRASVGGAILPLVVRVPSVAPPIAPERIALTSTPTSASITLRVPPDPDVSHLLVFSMNIPLTGPLNDLSGAELLRTPNRRDLYPLQGIRLRAPTGDLLAPAAKALSDPDVTADAEGRLSAAITVPATFGNWIALWSFTLSKDGIPSRPAGPFTVGVPKA